MVNVWFLSMEGGSGCYHIVIIDPEFNINWKVGWNVTAIPRYLDSNDEIQRISLQN